MPDKSKQFKRQNEWNKANVTRINVPFTHSTEQELLDWLNKQPSKAGYIKSLIRADMEKNNA